MNETVTPIIDAHIAEHYAQLYKAQMALQMGMDLPQPGQESDPQMEAQLAQAAAMVPQIVMPARPMQSDPAGEAKAKATEADIARKDEQAKQQAYQQAMQLEQQTANEIAKSLLEEAAARNAMEAGQYGGPAAQPMEALTP
jgi:uncharacterized membrane protein YfhO